MPKIMIIGAYWEQEPILERAKQKGLYVVATNAVPEADGFKYADEKYVVNPRDLKRLEEIFQKTKPDALIADECDYSMFAVAYLANKYALPGPKIDSLLITNNKYLERRCAESLGLKQPAYRLCFTYTEVKEASRKLGFPLMLKPVDNRGAIGVRKVESEEDLLQTYYEMLPESHARQVLVEEYIDGNIQVNIEGVYAGSFHNLTYSDKQKYPGACVDMHLNYPGSLSDNLVQKIYQLNKRLVDAIGIDYGLTHTEFIVKDNQPYLLEIHNRGGGINVSNKIVPAVTGVDTIDILLRSAFGEKVSFGDYPQKKRQAVLQFFDFGRGRVAKISGREAVKKMEGVLTLWVNIKENDFLKQIDTGPSRHGCVIVAADTLKGCNAIVARVKDTLKVEFA